MSKRILVVVLVFALIVACSGRERAVMAMMAETGACSGVEALPIHWSDKKCVAATCDADCKEKHGKGGHGECYSLASPDDTCKCEWNNC